MKIGIIGAGYIGGTMAHLLAEAGHEVALSNSRKPSTLEDIVAEAICKTCSGERKWDPKRGPLEPWLTYQVKSLMSHVVDSAAYRHEVALLDTLGYNRLRFHGDAITNDLTFPFVVFWSAALHGLIRRSAFGAGLPHC